MAKRKKSKQGAAYRGFRMGVVLLNTVNLKRLEKASVLTSLEHTLVEDKLKKCNKEIKDEEGKVIGTELVVSEKYKQRLELLLAKPFNEAKVDGKGNAWEKPITPTKEEVEAMNLEAVEATRKSKTVEDLEKSNA